MDSGVFLHLSEFVNNKVALPSSADRMQINMLHMAVLIGSMLNHSHIALHSKSVAGVMCIAL
jgi:hypothetical protein